MGATPKAMRRKKGSLKVHMKIVAHDNMAKFVKIIEVRMNDKKILKYLIMPSGSMIVFDKAYNHNLQFTQWTDLGVNSVCSFKDNAKYEVQLVLFEKDLTNNNFGLYKKEHIHFKYIENKKVKNLYLRKVTYKDEKVRIYKFITNNFEISNEEVPFQYKKCWNKETMVKKMKQNFKHHYFYSETENMIRTLIWFTIIAK